jgi:hypothetical protein
MTNKSKKFEDLGWAIVWRVYATMKHHELIWIWTFKTKWKDKSNLCLINLGHWGWKGERACKWSEINIHYFVLRFSMKDGWFLWPLFCNRVWYDSPVFDLSTIIDKLGLHMVQSKCIMGLDSFLCLSEIFVCVMKLWNILGHSSTPKMEH